MANRNKKLDKLYDGCDNLWYDIYKLDIYSEDKLRLLGLVDELFSELFRLENKHE